MGIEHTAGNTTIKDSGYRREFESGAHRDAGEGKGFFHLLPYQGLLEVAQVFEGGAKKYTSNNWRLGMPLSVYVNSGLRHLLKASQGWDDENHMAMAAWNALCFIETRHMINQGSLPSELDDIDNWLTVDGVAEAMAGIRRDNAAKQVRQRMVGTGPTNGEREAHRDLMTEIAKTMSEIDEADEAPAEVQQEQVATAPVIVSDAEDEELSFQAAPYRPADFGGYQEVKLSNGQNFVQAPKPSPAGVAEMAGLGLHEDNGYLAGSALNGGIAPGTGLLRDTRGGPVLIASDDPHEKTWPVEPAPKPQPKLLVPEVSFRRPKGLLRSAAHAAFAKLGFFPYPTVNMVEKKSDDERLDHTQIEKALDEIFCGLENGKGEATCCVGGCAHPSPERYDASKDPR